MSSAVIFDRDSTLADITATLPLLRQKPDGWRKFNEAIPGDPILPKTVAWLRSVPETVDIVILTSRDEVFRPLMEEWLNSHRLRHDLLVMRPKGDHRDAAIVKRDLLENAILPKYDEILYAMDDSDPVGKMFQEEGILWVDAKVVNR